MHFNAYLPRPNARRIMLEPFLLALEIIGTISFAVSGAFVAIRSKLDIFGVLFIGCITAIGGGILRDLIIGVTPPAIFSNLYIILIAALSALAVFIIAYILKEKFNSVSNKIGQVNNFFDALGLAAFSVTGTEVAFINGLSGNIPLSILLGLLTGVGGGMIRDVLTNSTPYIFKKHVYALASISGSCLYFGLRFVFATTVIPTLCGLALVLVIRMLATKYRWSLPKVVLDEPAPSHPLSIHNQPTKIDNLTANEQDKKAV